MPLCTSSDYGNHILGSVNVKKQKRIIDVDQLQVLEAALLFFILCVCSDKVTEKSNLTVKIKTINTLPVVGTIFSMEDSVFSILSYLDPLTW